MAVVVALTFDSMLGEPLSELMADTYSAYGGLDLAGQGVVAHATLGIFETADVPALIEVLRDLAACSPLDIQVSSAGTFGGDEGIVFVAPVVTSRLLEIHSRVHTALAPHTEGPFPYYERGAWVPHITLGHKLTSREVGEAVVSAREQLPLSGAADTFWVIDTSAMHQGAVLVHADIPFVAPGL